MVDGDGSDGGGGEAVTAALAVIASGSFSCIAIRDYTFPNGWEIYILYFAPVFCIMIFVWFRLVCTIRLDG